MASGVKIFVVLACVFRLWTLVVSVQNERRLKREGAREYGRANSLVLGILHTLLYVAAIVEGAVRGTQLDAISIAGMVIYVLGGVGLVFVIRTLGRLWSLKLLIASNHELVVHPMFRALRHPNYFVGVLPELIGFGLALHGFVTLAVGMPLYLISLYLRIQLEEQVMSKEFVAY